MFRKISGARADFLTALDCAHLRLDSAGHPMQWVLAFELESGAPIDIDTVRARVAARAAEHTMYRMCLPQRIRRRPRFRLAADIDLRHHVTAATVPNHAALLETIGQLLAGRMTHTRPLWDLTLVDERDRGGQTVLLRVHHCLCDGLAAPGFAALFVDTTSDTTADYARFISSGRFPFPRVVTRQTWTAVPQARRASRKTRARSGPQPFPPPDCARRVEVLSLPIRELRENASRAGGSTTEYLLAASAIAYRRAFAPARSSAEGLRMMLPVTLDHALRHAGNATGTAFIEVDPEVDRVRDQIPIVRAELTRTESANQALELARASIDLKYLPWRMQAWVMAGFAHGSCDLSVSITPGFTHRQTVFGHTVTRTLPFSPMMADEIMVTALILRDALTVGVVADPRVLPKEVAAFTAELDALIHHTLQPVPQQTLEAQ